METGTILGTVTDSSGGTVPNVAITVTNTDTGLATHLTTGTEGDYVAPLLPIGHYTIEVKGTNFKSATTSITLEVGDRRRVDFKLEVGTASESVTVTANAIAVQSDTNDISSVLTGVQLKALEEGGQSIYNLVDLVPGASTAMDAGFDVQLPTPMGGDDAVSFNGQREAHALFMIDGGEAADRGGNGTDIMPSEQALSEVRVMTSNYDAEYGLESGATITEVLTSGTNALHANAWYFGRNDALNARNYFNPAPEPVSEYRYNLFGFNVGGPVKFHDFHSGSAKTFFFYNMEWRRQVTAGSSLNLTVPFTSTYGGNLTQAFTYGALPANTRQAQCNGTGPEITVNALISNACLPQTYFSAPFVCQLSTAEIVAFGAAGQALSPCTGSSPNYAAAVPLAFGGVNNVINAALLNPNAAKLLTAGIFPSPNVPNTDSFSGGAKAPTSVKEEIVRIDHTFNDHWAIFGNWISEQVLQTDVPTRWDGTNDPTDSDTFGNPSYQAVVHLTDTISPTLLNEIAFNYDGNRIDMLPAGLSSVSGTGFAQNKLFPGSATNILPAVNVNGRTGIEFSNNWNPWINSANGYQIRDDVSWTKRTHQVKFGFDWFKFDKLQPLQDSIAGSFGFNGGFTGYDFADYLLGLSNSYSESALEDSRQWNSVSWGAYIEDDWRTTKRLTLNLGLRWEGDPHTAEVNNQMAMFIPSLWNAAGAATAFAPGSGIGFANSGGSQICSGAGIPNSTCKGANPFLGTGPNPALNGLLQYDNGLAVAGQTAGVTGGLVPNYWDTFGPRVGFAYDVTGAGKTVIRAGFGIFFERIQGNDMYQESSNLFGGSTSVADVSFTNPHTGIDQNNAVISAATLPVTVNSLTALNPLNYKTPTSYQYSMGVQQQIGRQTVLSVAYVGNQGRHESEQSGINSIPLSDVLLAFSGTSANGTTNLYRPYLGYSGVTLDSDDARSRYNSVQVSLRSQFRALTLQGAYTYSHAFDPTSNSEDGGDLSGGSNPYAGWLYDYGPAAANRDSILLVDFVYNLPKLTDKGAFLRIAAGGWQLAGVVTLETGDPLNIGIGGGTQTICAVVSNCSVRPNLIGAISYPNTPTALSGSPVGSVQWFSPSSFAPNLLAGANGNIATFGSLGNNGVWGPGRDNWDLSLIKDFAFSERLRLELRVDAINVWNHVQWSAIDTGVGDANFGKATGAYPGRDAQLGAKISW